MKEQRMIDPERPLEDRERASLAALVGNEGFKVLQTIMESECQKFTVKLINANPANQNEVIAAHHIAKAAAQFYTAVMNRLSNEIEAYTKAPRLGDKPIDLTEGLLDIGDDYTGGEHGN